MIIEKWHNVSSLSELATAIDQLKEWATANKIDPDTIYLQNNPNITFFEFALTDRSKTYDIKIT